MLDSAEAIALIDSAYVQARQDFAYASLTGSPTNVSTFANDAGYLTDADTLDSAEVIGLVDSAYVQLRQTPQDFAYASLTGAPTNVSAFTNDAGYLTDATTLDSAEVLSLIDSAYISNRFPTGGSSEVITPVAFAFVNTTANGSGTGISWSNWNAGTATLDFTFSTAQPDTNYAIITDCDVYDDYNVSISSKTTSGFSASFYDDAGGNRTPSSSAPFTFLIYGSNPKKRIAGLVGDYLDSAAAISLITAEGFTKYDSANTTGMLSTYATQTYVTNAIDNLVDGAPGTLDTLNEIAAALNDDDSAYGTLLALINAKTNYDSANTIGLIDSAYVQTRVNKTFIDALNIDADTLDGQSGLFYLDYNNFINAPNILDSADIQAFTLDSAEVTTLINSAYIQARQDYAYSSLTGAPNVLDSNDVTALIDSAYVAARTSAGTDSATVVAIINDTVDSAYISALGFGTGGGTDSATVISLITSTVDSAYVALREADAGVGGGGGGGGTDSATVSAIIINDVDSAYVQARQLNEVAAPLTQLTTNFVATTGQTSFTGLDIDSDKFQIYLNGLLLPRADYTHNSTQVDLLVAASSGDVLEVLKFSGNDTGVEAIQQRHYIYTATSGQTVFTGADNNSQSLSYTQGRVNVYLNGLLLIDSDDYTQNAGGTSITFTSGVTAGHLVNIQTLSGNTGTFAPLEQTLYEFTADSGQTVFTGADNNATTLNFSNDKIVVYLNGILLSSGDYTPSGGNTITLDVGTDSGNLLTVAKLSGNNIGLDSGQVNALIGASGPSGVDSAAVNTLINNYIIDSDTALSTTTANQVVDTFSASIYRTAKYIVQMSHSSGYHSNEILLVHDGSTVYMTTYAEVITASSLGTIDADINSGNVRLLVTPTNTNTDINITRINVDV